MTKIMKGYETPDELKSRQPVSSVVQRYSSKEIHEARSNGAEPRLIQDESLLQRKTGSFEKQTALETASIVVSMPATEANCLTANEHCTILRFSHIGPAAFDMWLRPELEAIGGKVHLCGDDNSGEVQVPNPNEEAAREIIMSWCILEEAK